MVAAATAQVEDRTAAASSSSGKASLQATLKRTSARQTAPLSSNLRRGGRSGTAGSGRARPVRRGSLLFALATAAVVTGLLRVAVLAP